MLELTERSLRSAATAFGKASRASASSNSVCRCRFDASTKSRSIIRRRPTPARASRFAAAAPIAPQPTTTPLDASNRRWPSSPMPAKSICREYFSRTVSTVPRSFMPSRSIIVHHATNFSGQATPVCCPSSERNGSIKVSRASGLRGIVAVGVLLTAAGFPAWSQQPTSSVPEVASAPAPSSTEELVVEVRIITEDGRVLPPPPANITVQPGNPLDRGQGADSIRALIRTGDYADVRAVATRVPGGVRLDFVVQEQLFFNRVIINGLVSPPTEASALAAVQLQLGEPFQRATLDEGLERLREILREEGLYTAQVSAETVPYRDTHQIDVIVDVKPGPRARVKEIQLQNGTEYGDSEILSRFKMKPRTSVTSARIQRGTDRIRKFLVKKSHLNARAVVRRGA